MLDDYLSDMCSNVEEFENRMITLLITLNSLSFGTSVNYSIVFVLNLFIFCCYGFVIFFVLVLNL